MAAAEVPSPLARFGPPFGAALVAFCWQLPLFNRWFSAMDEGHILQYADLVNHGGTLYRDATIYPLPGSFYLLSLAFRLFGPSILVARWLVLLEFCLLVAMSWVLVRKLVSTHYAVACVALLLLYRVWAFPQWQMYGYSSLTLLMLAASMLALLAFFRSSRPRDLCVSGLLFGLGVFCKQDYGAAALLASGASLVAYTYSRPREQRIGLGTAFAWFLAPAVGVGAVAGLHFFSVGILGQVIQMTVLNHFVGLASFDYAAFAPLLPFFEQDPALRSGVGLQHNFPPIVFISDWRTVSESFLYTQTPLYDVAIKLFIYGPIALVLGGGVRLWYLRSALRDPATRDVYGVEFALLAFGAAFVLLAHGYRPQDYVHLSVLYWPLICLTVVYAHALFRTRRGLMWSVAAVALVPTVAFVGYSGRLVWNFHSLHDTRLSGPRAGIFVKASEAAILGEMVEYTRRATPDDEPVAVMPYFPILHFLAERRAPHGASYILWPFPEFPERDRRIIDAMEASKTPVLLYNINRFPEFPPVEQYASELFSHLVGHFEIDRVFNSEFFGYSMIGARRQDQAPPGRPLFDAASAKGSLVIERRGDFRSSLLPEQRDSYLRVVNWPFRPTISVRPSTNGNRTVFSIPLLVPPGARLRTAVSIHPSAWDRYPSSWVRFEIAATIGSVREPLYSRTLVPHEKMGDRGWAEVDIPLDEYAGSSIVLHFSTEAGHPISALLGISGWDPPRLLASGTAQVNSR